MAQNPGVAGRAPRSGTATPNASHGSQTILQTDAGPARLASATLRLRAGPSEDASSQPGTQDARRVRWAEEVVDNEGMGKKSSKICCIYHAPHTHDGESDADSSSSSSDDDSGSEPDLSRAQPAGGRRGRSDGGSNGKGKGKDRKPSPNAYERQPNHQKAGPT